MSPQSHSREQTNLISSPVCLSELLKKVEELTEERDQLLAKGEDLRRRLKEAHAAQQELEAQRENASQTLAQVQITHAPMNRNQTDHFFSHLCSTLHLKVVDKIPQLPSIHFLTPLNPFSQGCWSLK